MKRLIALPLIFLIACTGAQLIQAFSTAIQVASECYPIVAAAYKAPTAQSIEIMGWLADANEGLSASSSIIGSGKTKAEIAAGITVALSKIVARQPRLEGTPANVAQAVGDVAAKLD